MHLNCEITIIKILFSARVTKNQKNTKTRFFSINFHLLSINHINISRIIKDPSNNEKIARKVQVPFIADIANIRNRDAMRLSSGGRVEKLCRT